MPMLDFRGALVVYSMFCGVGYTSSRKCVGGFPIEEHPSSIMYRTYKLPAANPNSLLATPGSQPENKQIVDYRVDSRCACCFLIMLIEEPRHYLKEINHELKGLSVI